jgi:peptidoglycan/LPS O-acetylase OafA/YrhL
LLGVRGDRAFSNSLEPGDRSNNASVKIILAFCLKIRRYFFYLSTMPNISKSSNQFYFQIINQIRGFFCIYIIFHNLVINLYQVGVVSLPLKIIASLGQEVVIGFFLISGFLMFYSLNHKYFSFQVFLLKRFERIYIPFIVSLLVSIVVAYATGNLSKNFNGSDLMGNLLLLQDFGSVKPGTWFYPFLGNLPLWSLSYQWWFYILVYPIYRFLPKSRIRIYLVLLMSITAYLIYWQVPNQVCLILSYFILEWLGLEIGYIYFKYKQLNLQNTKDCLICMVAMVGLTMMPIFETDRIQLGYYPFLIFRHFLMGLLFLVVILFSFQVNWKNIGEKF